MNNILKLYEPLFEKEQIHTEKQALECLESQPLDDHVGFVSVPWSVVLNEGIGLTDADYDLIKRFCRKFKRTFTVVQHIRYRELRPLFKLLGIQTLFTPHCDISQIDGMKIEPFPHLAVNATEPKKKDILFSFVGAEYTHYTRKKLFDHLLTYKHEEVIIKKRDEWHFVNSREEDAEFYKDVLSRSSFALCPAGTGPGTIRLYEAAKSGAVPVVISDSLILPKAFWSVVRISEAEFCELVETPHVLVQRFRSMYGQMMDDGDPVQDTTWCYAQHSGSSFVSCIRSFYEDKK